MQSNVRHRVIESRTCSTSIGVRGSRSGRFWDTITAATWNVRELFPIWYCQRLWRTVLNLFHNHYTIVCAGNRWNGRTRTFDARVHADCAACVRCVHRWKSHCVCLKPKTTLVRTLHTSITNTKHSVPDHLLSRQWRSASLNDEYHSEWTHITCVCVRVWVYIKICISESSECTGRLTVECWIYGFLYAFRFSGGIFSTLVWGPFHFVDVDVYTYVCTDASYGDRHCCRYFFRLLVSALYVAFVYWSWNSTQMTCMYAMIEWDALQRKKYTLQCNECSSRYSSRYTREWKIKLANVVSRWVSAMFMEFMKNRM